MTTKAKPKFYFNNIKFNSSYYDTEIDDNIPRPINQSTSTLNSVLTLTNLSPIQTSWLTIPTQITSYVDFNNTTKILNSNVSGNIVDLILSSSIGISTAQKFALPSNSSSAINNSVLTINSTNKTTQWLTIPIQITDYVDYNDVKDTLIRYNNNILGPETITDLVIGSIGSNISQKFVLPSNSSTGVLNSVLTLSNISTRETTWMPIPVQISSYVNFNNANSNLISNVSGTPTTVSSISISGLLTSGNINCGSINANSNLIETTGNLQSRGLTIKNISNSNVLTISNLGDINSAGAYSGANYIYTSSGDIQTASGDIYTNTGELRSRGLKIKNTSNIDVATISNLGALVCTTIQNNNNTINCGNITSGSINCTTITTNNNTINSGTGSISGGALSCTTLTSSTLNGLTCLGLIVKNSSNTDVATISNLGALSCTTITSNNNTITSGTSSVFGGSIISSVFNSGAPGSDLDIGSNQVGGNLTIGNNVTRSGSVNICSLASNNAINIGNSSSTQTININRPIRLPGLLYTSGSEIGYSQNNAVFFSTGTANPVLPNTRMNTPITATNLINNANYMIRYSLLIIPQANFNVSRFQYGLYDTGYMTGLSQNNSVLSGTTTSIRFDTTDTYSYSGSGFFKYDSTKTYNLSFTMAFLATAPYVQTNIDLIRIS